MLLNVLKSRFNRRRSSSVAVGTLISKRTCRGLTYPKVTPLLEELAEPKTPPRSPSRCRSSSVSRVLYKPRGRFTFVDTTKMTNAEFKEYHKKRLAENRNF
uniref:Uncharacterized protein n=1 Tax=Panagrolaimus superbus TaxID=310955 RepID=A0A914YCU7_9BILA